MNAERALEYWQKEGLLSEKKAKELEASLSGKDQEMTHRAIRIFSVVGAMLIGLGVILFVASNWQSMTPLLKITLLILGVVASGGFGYYLGYEKKGYEKTGMALLLVNVLIFGASIFLVGQIYNLPLNFWWGALLWFLGTFVFAYILTSRLHLWLSVPLFLLFVGWLSASQRAGWNELDFLFNPQYSLLVLLPILGIGILSFGLLHRLHRQLRFGATTLFNWGAFLTIATIVLSTIDKAVFFQFFRFPTDPVSLGVLIGSALLFVAALIFGKFQTKEGRFGLLALALYIGFLYALVFAPEWLGFPMEDTLYNGMMYSHDVLALPIFTWLFVLHLVLVFIFLFVLIWYGTLLRQVSIINMGMIAIAIVIFIQYFSWAFAMSDRSIAFILGGILILVVSALLERQRKTLVSSFRTPKKSSRAKSA